MNSISSWLCTNGTKNLFVKIVHPGGHVELHDRPILASELLNRNPKCCVAHPIVFQQPYAIVSPETTLALGQKYYVVPLGTIRKLQLKHHHLREAIDRQSIGRKKDEDAESSSFCWLFRKSSKKGGKEKMVNLGMRSKSSSSESLMNEDSSSKGGNGNGNGGSSSPGRISLVSMDNWQPGLDSIAED